MARTQISKELIANRNLTGASFIPELGFYDETKNYSVGDVVFWKGKWYTAVNNITSSTLEGDLANAPDVSSDWEEMKPQIYSVYPSSSQNFSNTPITIAFDTERYNGFPGAFNISNGEITFNSNGTFLISVNVSYNNTTTTRDTITTSIQLDTGSGYADISNLKLYNYSRTSADGKDTSSTTFPLTVNTGDKLQIQAVGRTTSTLSTVPDGCNITIFPIESVSGPKGDKGDIGPTGPSGDLKWQGVYDNTVDYYDRDTVEYQGSTFVATATTTGTPPGDPNSPNAPWELVAKKGADGAGATITIQDDGSNIPNTPHGTLNFGANITAVDAGGGVADISVNIPKNIYMVAVWAEENAALGNNTYEWAFGNGANTPNGNGVTIFVPSGYKCELVAMTLCLRQGTATVEALKNSTLLGSQANVSGGAGSSTNELTTPIEYQNGDIINFRTTSASGTGGPNTVTAWFRYTEL